MKELNDRQKQVLATIADASSGEISGTSIATWLLCRRDYSGLRETLKCLQRRGLITMRPMDDPNDEYRKQWPDMMKAMYSIVKIRPIVIESMEGEMKDANDALNDWLKLHRGARIEEINDELFQILNGRKVK